MAKSRRTAANLARLTESFLSCRSMLMRMLGRLVRPQEIEDIVQETFVRSYVAVRSTEIHNPQAFLVKTARHLALDYLKRADQRLNQCIDDVPEAEVEAAPADTPESRLESREQFLAFCEAVARLPVKCRRVFILRKVYGLTHREIADYLGIAESTVDTHITNGMALTAEHMSDRGHLIGGQAPGGRMRRTRGKTA